MIRPELGERMTRRRVLALCVGGTAAAILAACGTPSTGGSVPGAASQGSEPGPGGSGLRIRITGEEALGGMFEPAQLMVRIGETVTWENVSSKVHTVTCDPGNPVLAEHLLPQGAAAFNSGNVYASGTFEHTFDVAGNYTYSCLPHSDHVGQLTVTA